MVSLKGDCDITTDGDVGGFVGRVKANYVRRGCVLCCNFSKCSGAVRKGKRLNTKDCILAITPGNKVSNNNLTIY
jgi:hypothetical protein